MLTSIRQLPTPLKALVQANILLAAIEIAIAGYCLARVSLAASLPHLGDAAIALLVIAGVLGRYRLIRWLCLALGFVGAALKSFWLIVQLSAPTLVMIADFVILGFFIFVVVSLSTPSAKAYFKSA